MGVCVFFFILRLLLFNSESPGWPWRSRRTAVVVG